MASEKKASEGIALLSMYADEDDEMEELDEEVANIHEDGVPLPASDAVSVNDNDGSNDFGNEHMQRQQEERGQFNDYTAPASATPQQTLFSPQEQLQAQQFSSDLNNAQSQKSRLTIVDYGHEEGAMSPEAEGSEVMATGRVMYGEQLQSSDGESREKISPGVAGLPTPSTQAATPQSLEPADQPETDTMSYATNESEAAGTEDAVMVSVEDQKNVDPLDNFLPPPPKAKCSEELQEKISRFLALKKTTGRSFNAEVRNRKEYRNPDFLLHAVTYQDIDQIGSCFRKDVFDPHGYDKSDFYDEIEVDMRREMERKEQERKKSQTLEFTPGGVQLGNVLPTSKINIPTPNGIARDGRQSKKSKWDKVDVDQKSFLTAGGQENLSAVGAHAALLSAAKAGSGYSAFVQQRRKEAEDRRSSDRKSDRRQ
ncbi:SAP30-binding protein-like isoform X2 [Salvia divinorum]|uniref:SAP30-binding protein-like isoform X2 n=1 Tax=Salvia divinorum TaxID=28513 RepID=A0ABD1HV27_SALDI